MVRPVPTTALTLNVLQHPPVGDVSLVSIAYRVIVVSFAVKTRMPTQEERRVTVTCDGVQIEDPVRSIRRITYLSESCYMQHNRNKSHH